MNLEQVTVDVNPEIGIDPEQVLIVGGMMEDTHGDSVVHDRLTSAVEIGKYMGRVKQSLLRESGERTAPAIGADHQLSKNRLMEPPLGLDDRVTAKVFAGVKDRSNADAHLARNDVHAKILRVPLGDEDRKDWHVESRSDAVEVDQG